MGETGRDGERVPTATRGTGTAMPCRASAGRWRAPGHSAHPLAVAPRTRVLQTFSRQRGQGQGGLPRPPARSALHSPPLSPSPRRQLERCFAGAQGSGRASRAGCHKLLCATTPGLPLRHALVPAMLLCPPAAWRPPACWSPAAAARSGSRQAHAVGSASCSSLTEQSCLSASRRLLRAPGATCTSPERRARPAPQRGGELCFGSALQPVLPTALAPGLAGAALGCPPSGCRTLLAFLTLGGGQG